MSFQKSSRFLLNELMDAASTTDGGSWFQASMTLCEKKFFPQTGKVNYVSDSAKFPSNSTSGSITAAL